MTAPAGSMNAIRISAAFTSLGQVACFVDALARRAELPASAAYRLRLATDEIVSNIIMHGYRGGPGEITLSGDVTADCVWLRVEDQSPRFDPGQARGKPRPRIASQDREPGGFGLFLVFQSVDDFRYEFASGTNSNILSMSRNHPGRCS